MSIERNRVTWKCAALAARAILEQQSRDFTYVEDVAELNLKAARAKNVSGP